MFTRHEFLLVTVIEWLKSVLYYRRYPQNKTGYPFLDHPVSHTRTVVRVCFKGDEASQWKRPKFDPSPHQNPLTDLHQNWQAWLRPGQHPACKICSDRFKGFCSPNTWFCRAFGVTIVCWFFWFFNKATASLHPWADIYAKYVKWRRSG